jgi:uncharacterized DUF497 family protein
MVLVSREKYTHETLVNAVFFCAMNTETTRNISVRKTKKEVSPLGSGSEAF